MSVTRHWPAGPEVRLQSFPGGAMVYDASRAGNADPGWLDARWWSERGAVRPTGAGRGGSYFIEADERSFVLRHYRRGGLMAHVSKDQYWWRNANETRSFVEWHLLYLMRRRGLPVPEPIAAGYRRQGHTYTADLLIERIAGTATLAERLSAGSLPISVWVGVGRCLRRFHASSVCHADLNAHNILLDAEDHVWVIDFDRARLRTPGLWTDANLARLYRSLVKISAGLPAERFAAADWSSLLDGYFAEAAVLDAAA